MFVVRLCKTKSINKQKHLDDLSNTFFGVGRSAEMWYIKHYIG